jgi:hypothetical protein
VLKRYLDCFEELITLPTLTDYLDIIIKENNIVNLID